MENKSVDELLFLSDGRRNLICVPYSIENMKKMADELGIKKTWLKKDRFVIPEDYFEVVETKCNIVSTQTLFRTLKGIS